VSNDPCPDCGGELDVNDECPGWYGEEPNLPPIMEKNMSHGFVLMRERGPVLLRIDRRAPDQDAAQAALALLVRVGLCDRRRRLRDLPMLRDPRFGQGDRRKPENVQVRWTPSADEPGFGRRPLLVAGEKVGGSV